MCSGDRRWGTTTTISHPLGIYRLAGDTTPQLYKFMVLKNATERGMWYSGAGAGCKLARGRGRPLEELKLGVRWQFSSGYSMCQGPEVRARLL